MKLSLASFVLGIFPSSARLIINNSISRELSGKGDSANLASSAKQKEESKITLFGCQILSETWIILLAKDQSVLLNMDYFAS